MTQPPQSLEQLTKHAGQLYSLPAVALRVMELTDQSDVDIPRLKECIETDPALTTKVLRVVNGSLFSLSGEVSELTQALALLGIKPLKLLVLGFSLPEALFADLEEDVLQRYWHNTLVKAVAAREIGRRFWHSASDEAFIAALLEDLGQLVLLKQFKQQYADFLLRVDQEGADLAEREKEVFGFEHRALSASLLRRWHLPEGLASAIEWQRSVDSLQSLAAPQSTLPQILHLAELVASVLDRRCPERLEEMLDAGEAYQGIDYPQFQKLLDDLEVKVTQLADAMSIELSGEQNYNEILAEAHQRLSVTAADVAGDVVRYRRDHSGDTATEESLWDEARVLGDTLSKMLKWAIQSEGHESEAKPDANGNDDSRQMSSETTQKEMFSGGTSVASAKRLSPEQTDEKAFYSNLATAVTCCRAEHSSLSVAFFEIDRSPALLDSLGAGGSEKLFRLMEAACRMVDHPGVARQNLRPARLAMILPDCDRADAVKIARDVLTELNRMTGGASTEEGSAMTLSAGLASVDQPAKNFEPRALMDSADRCLYGAAISGGNSVKSIDVY